MKASRVLVVEDDALIGTYLAELLTAMGHMVCAVETTETGAVAASKQYKPDLMIVDVKLGNGSGIAAVDEILRSGFVPHVFVSGHILAVQTLRPDAIILQKPYSGPQLAWAIQRALGITPPC